VIKCVLYVVWSNVFCIWCDQMCSVYGVIKCVLYMVWSNSFWTDSQLTPLLTVDTSAARCR